MILSFKKKFDNGDPTYFKEKILASTGQHNEHSDRPKLHTIREDSHDRWKLGMLIHPAYGVRTKNYEQFTETLQCHSLQEIEFKWKITDDEKYCAVFIDGVFYGDSTWSQAYHPAFCTNYSGLGILASNDGFDGIFDMFDWFNKDFTGKIIHWTNLKY